MRIVRLMAAVCLVLLTGCACSQCDKKDADSTKQSRKVAPQQECDTYVPTTTRSGSLRSVGHYGLL